MGSHDAELHDYSDFHFETRTQGLLFVLAAFSPGKKTRGPYKKKTYGIIEIPDQLSEMYTTCRHVIRSI